MGRTFGWWLLLGMLVGAAFGFMAAFMFERDTSQWTLYGLIVGAVLGMVFSRSSHY